MPAADVAIATALGAAIATIIMGVYANFPFVLAPGMGINAYFTFGVVQGTGCILASRADSGVRRRFDLFSLVARGAYAP